MTTLHTVNDFSRISRAFTAAWKFAGIQFAVGLVMLLPLPIIMMFHVLPLFAAGLGHTGLNPDPSATSMFSEKEFWIAAFLYSHLNSLIITVALAAAIPGYYGVWSVCFSIVILVIIGLENVRHIFVLAENTSLLSESAYWFYWWAALPLHLLIAGLSLIAICHLVRTIWLQRDLVEPVDSLGFLTRSESRRLRWPGLVSVALRLALPFLVIYWASKIFMGSQFGMLILGVLSNLPRVIGETIIRVVDQIEGSELEDIFVFLFVLLFEYPAEQIAFGLSPYISGSNSQAIADFALIGLLKILTPLFYVFVGLIVVRFFQSLLRIRAGRRLSADARGSILLLRSFQDDAASVRSKFMLQRLVGRRVRLEEVISQQLVRIGRFIAIGTPGERLPRLGAVRTYLRDDEWQERVLQWLDEVRLVLMIVGTSNWVTWELSHAVRLGAVERMIFVFPPVREEEHERRCELLRRAFHSTQWSEALGQADLRNARVLRFLPNGALYVSTTLSANQPDFELALLTAMDGRP